MSSPMNFIAICLHSLDMRDFHSTLRDTPFLDELRAGSIFIPMGRGQGHHESDSLHAELTGKWTARATNSVLDAQGYHPPDRFQLPETIIETLMRNGYENLPAIAFNPRFDRGTYAVQGGMEKYWLRDEPERMDQFGVDSDLDLDRWIDRVRNTKKKFYAPIFLRETHRPWAQNVELFALMGLGSTLRRMLRKRMGLPNYWPHDAYCARRAALEKPDEFAALRRRGLAKADRIVRRIFEATRDIKDVTYLVYSNHGEVFDHFRYNQRYPHSVVNGRRMIEGTSHGLLPYETVYANMQMWVIPGRPARVMRGTGRSTDIAPTMRELAAVEAGTYDGESMLPHFDEGVLPERVRYAEAVQGAGCISMVREDGFKFLSVGADVEKEDTTFGKRGFPCHRLAAFDLKTDPYEYVNLIDTPQGRDLLDWAIRTHGELKTGA